jgi:hypothetical protein
LSPTLFHQPQILGGVPRFYKGIGFALIQAPLSKFASVAANDFTTLINVYSNSTSGNVVFTTALGGVLAALMRAALMPIDTCKTVLQVDGSQGFQKLTNKVISNCSLEFIFSRFWEGKYRACTKGLLQPSSQRLLDTIHGQ